MKFRKMHGCGNDFIIINGFKEDIKNITFEQRVFLSSLHFGIGSNGILYILPSKIADIKMQIFNSDGSEAEMCGNGIRCASKYAKDENIVNNDKLLVETKSGIKTVELSDNIKIGMGRAIELENPMSKYNLFCVSVGNPHAIMTVDNLENFSVMEIGKEIENYEKFPNKTNVEFAQIIDKRTVKIRVWERGCGETLACGTGACAVVFALYKNRLLDNKASVELLGGTLEIEIDKNDNVLMSGNAVNVFDGEIKL
ncbi:MAG: diaminopimelate epimerase [Rickettsiales bacterium]|jgi:diaminopimelate epimerase|nr:diaminopimelate epimerase [Rickettsiales bacterium]